MFAHLIVCSREGEKNEVALLAIIYAYMSVIN
jgi:hypothetical protein